jgi:hypothetical protein
MLRPVCEQVANYNANDLTANFADLRRFAYFMLTDTEHARSQKNESIIDEKHFVPTPFSLNRARNQLRDAMNSRLNC